MEGLRGFFRNSWQANAMRLQRVPSAVEALSAHVAAINGLPPLQSLPPETLRALANQLRSTGSVSPINQGCIPPPDSSNGSLKRPSSQGPHLAQQNGRTALPEGISHPPPPRVQSSPDMAVGPAALEAAAYYVSRAAHGVEGNGISTPLLGSSPLDGMGLVWHLQEHGDLRHAGFRLVSPLGSPGLERRGSAGARMQAQPTHSSQQERQLMSQLPSYAMPLANNVQTMHTASGRRPPTARSEPDMGAHQETSWRQAGPPPPPPRASQQQQQQQRPPQQQQQRPRSAGQHETGRQPEPKAVGWSRSQSIPIGQGTAPARQPTGRAAAEGARNGGVAHLNGTRYRSSSQSAPSSPLRKGSSVASGPLLPHLATGMGYQAVPLARPPADARGVMAAGGPLLPMPAAVVVPLTFGDHGRSPTASAGVCPCLNCGYC